MGNCLSCANKPNFDTSISMYTKQNGDILSYHKRYNTPPNPPTIICHKTTKNGTISITESEYHEEVTKDREDHK